ncbi:MAG: hypothetical protein G01um101419_162 [Parcubacteria group bacterium Gr01-1014_19]|nr:MAG: hypothetical protein G01um101419_162 [Parcubacteria group bacterium Gr01-1014_19]
MPCTFSTVELKDGQRKKQKKRNSAAEKKKKIEKQKADLLATLGEMGFEVDVQKVDETSLLILGSKE